jgi:hypothetical protein
MMTETTSAAEESATAPVTISGNKYAMKAAMRTAMLLSVSAQTCCIKVMRITRGKCRVCVLEAMEPSLPIDESQRETTYSPRAAHIDVRH